LAARTGDWQILIANSVNDQFPQLPLVVCKKGEQNPEVELPQPPIGSGP